MKKLGIPDISLHAWIKNNPNHEVGIHGKKIALKDMARLGAAPDTAIKYKVTIEDGL